MKLAVCALLLPLCSAFLLSRKVCYDDVGCFSTDAPFRSLQRLITLLPETPDKVQTTFYLWTRDTPDVAREETLIPTNVPTITRSRFNASRPTKVIIHGWLDQGVHDKNKPWAQQMKAELLRQGDYNVIGVDWRGGNQLPYTQATANTRLVGAQVAHLIFTLEKVAGAKKADFHLIGHSLGAHVAGYTGERMTGLGRITALDAAEPYFQGTDPMVRLDPSDATFVDVIHSDASSLLSLGLGADQEMGHQDFYPNNGRDQPGCGSTGAKVGKSILSFISDGGIGAEVAFSCSHTAAIKFFIESINSPCPFRAYTCDSYEKFQQGKCLDCNGDRCARMGFHAAVSNARGRLYLATGDHTPYCNYHYGVSAKVSDNHAVTKGQVQVSLQGTKAISQPAPLTEPDTRITAGSTVSALVHTRVPLGEPQNALLKFSKIDSFLQGWIYPNKAEFSSLSVFTGETQAQYGSCMSQARITNHNTEEVIPLSSSRCA